MLGRNVFVLQALRFIEGALKNFVRGLAKVLLGHSRNFWQALDLLLDLSSKRRRRHSEFFEQGRDYSVALREQGPEQMERLDLLLPRTPAYLLSGLQGLFSLYRKFF